MEYAKGKPPTALLTVEKIVVLYEMDERSDKYESNHELDDHVEWDEKEDRTVLYLAEKDRTA